MELGDILNRLESSLLCGICKSDLKDPVSARCKHSFCEKCAAKACRARLPCPHCGKCSKSRSLNKSARLHTLVPLVKKLMDQTHCIANLFQEDHNGSKPVEPALNPDQHQSVNDDIHKVHRDPIRRRKATAKNGPRLWGRLLTAHASSSSSEFDEPQRRTAVLHNEVSVQSVEAKVTNWLESSIPDSDTMKDQSMTKDQLNDGVDQNQQSDFSDDLITNSLPTTKLPDDSAVDCHPKANEVIPINNCVNGEHSANDSSIFPKNKTLKTFGATHKVNANFTPQVLYFSEDSPMSSAVDANEQTLNVGQRNSAEANVLTAEACQTLNSNADSSQPKILNESEETRLGHNNDHSQPQASLANESTPRNSLQPKKAPDNNGLVQQYQLYNRVPIIDKVSVTACGYVDIHNPAEDSNIVLQHLENAIADLPYGDAPYFNCNGTEQDTVRQKTATKRKGIVHSTADVITVISDSPKFPKVTGKRRAQTGLRTRPAKVSKFASLHRNPSGITSTRRRNLHSQPDRIQNLTSCASENDLPVHGRNVSSNTTERSCVSDGKLTMFSTYSACNLESLPKSLTSAFVKMVRLDERVKTLEREMSTEVISPNTETYMQKSFPKPAQMKGRSVHIDLTQTQDWEQEESNNEADNIICCSWNEAEKNVNQSWHEEHSDIDSQVDIINPPNPTTNGDDGEGNITNAIVGKGEINGHCHQSNVTPSKKSINDVIHALDAVVSLDKEFLSKYFPISSDVVYQAIDSTQCAVAALKKEALEQYEIVVSNPYERTVEELRNGTTETSVPPMQNGVDAHFVADCDNGPQIANDSSLNVIADQTVVQSSLPDNQANTISLNSPCDDLVTAKVESWLNKLGNFSTTNTRQENDHPDRLKLSTHQSNSASNKLQQNESDGAGEDAEAVSDMINRRTVSENPRNALHNSDKAHPSLSTHERSRSSSPETRRSVMSHVDPDLDVEFEDVENDDIKYFDESMECDSELVKITTCVSNKAEISESLSQKQGKPGRSCRSNVQVHARTNQARRGLKKSMGDFAVCKISESHDAIGISAANSKIDRQFGFITSGLHEYDMKHVRTFAKLFNSKHLDRFIPDRVTHVIMKATAKRGCDRTLKYLLGIACKKWIVSIKWVMDSLHAGKRLPEDEYEMLGDNCMQEFHYEPVVLPRGPTRSRVSAENLLENYLCLCLPPFSLVTDEQITQLLRYCGAVVVDDFSGFVESVKDVHFFSRVVIVDTEVISDFPDYSSIEQEHGATVVTLEWIYESISRFEIQPFDKFCLANFTQDSTQS